MPRKILDKSDTSIYPYCGILRAAVSSNNLQILNEMLLLTKNECNSYTDALSDAAHYGYVVIFKLLLEKGALMDEFIIFDAIIGGNLEIIQIILKSGIRLSFDDLIEIVKEGHLPIIRYILDSLSFIY